MKKNENYEVNFTNGTIVVSKKFLKEASILGTPAYKTLLEIRRDNPGFPIVIRKIKAKENKNSYANLTVKNMKTFIEHCMDSKKPLEDRLAEFETVQTLSKIQPSPYAYIKSWFLKGYGDEYNKYRDNEENGSEPEAKES